ncbi:MAG: phosphatidate cytidylyltransferase [Rhizomicrobium sp.]
MPVAALAAKGGGGKNDHAPGIRGIRLNWDWVTRPLFGGALAALALGAVFGGTPYVALFAAVAAAAAAREWHRMLGERVFGPTFYITSIGVAVALAAEVAWPGAFLPWGLLAAGGAIAALYAQARGHHPLWHGAGALYIGAPMLYLVLLRDLPHGAWIIVGLFVAIWAADTGALITGNLIGGPRLWPALSPNKTWSGTVGGILIASAFEAIYLAVLGGHGALAALYGAAIATVAVAGDLFESWVKRKFQRKDSGGLIPGHGGVLDRIDSTLFAAPVLAVFVLGFGFNPMLGGHP